MAATTALPGVALYGHLSQPFGLGSAARGLAAALGASGLRFAAIDLPWPTAERARDVLPTPAELGMEVGLIATNPDILRRCMGTGAMPGPSAGGRAFMIGQWHWESATGLPQEWPAMSVLFDEIWASSSYGAACIAPFVDRPVVPVPPALPPKKNEAGIDLAPFGIVAGAYTFLSIFDGRGNLDRKNPIAVIRAFCMAFPRPQPAVRLLLKSRGLSAHDRAILERSMAGRPDIRLLALSMTEAEVAALIRSCNCLVSLHRAEALGLVMAEAMAEAKPVIATGHSGNLEFMTPAGALLANYDLVPLRQDSPPFRRGTVWAEAHVAHAARLMRQVHDQPEQARTVAERGARQVRSILSPEAAGARIAARLALLARTGRIPAPAPPAVPSHSMLPRSQPTLLVATPIKNGAPYIDRYFGLLRSLAVDPARLSIAILEGDSSDGSWDRLCAMRDDLEARYRRVTLMRHDFGYRLPPGPRYQPSGQERRRSVLAKARNRLLAGALADEDWVLWLDVDLVEYPPDLIDQLLDARQDIVVPHCVLPNGRTFDRNTFFLSPGADGKPLGDDPVREDDDRRRYLEDSEGGDPVELHGVGGTVLLVRADLHREGLVFPAAPYRGHLETEGLAVLARDLGYRCVGLPAVRVVHPPV